jgi:hypothetical protein
MEEMMNLDGDDMDLKLLVRSFPNDIPRVEKRDGQYLLILESEAQREDTVVVADGTKVLAQMVAIMLKDGSNFRRPRIRGMTKQNPDGSLSHYVNLSVKMEARVAVFVEPRRIGPDGKEIVDDKRPTEDQIVLELARNNEPFRRAQVIYGSLEHTWANLYKVIEAVEDGNGGERGLIAKNLVPGKDIKNFKDTANSWRAIDLEARHATPNIGSSKPKMTLAEAQEMFRKLLQGWIEELKAGG